MNLDSLLSLESAGILAACSALIAFTVKAWPQLRRLAHFLDDVQGEPARPGQPARPGWGERLQAIEEEQTRAGHRLGRVEGNVERVRAQTENSHSTNLRDDIDVVTARAEATEAMVRDLHEQHSRKA